MRLRKLLTVSLALGILSAPLAADAQRPAKVPRVGLLLTGSPPSATAGPFRHGLRDLGYVEGQNIAIEERWAEGKHERLPDLAAELVRLRVDVIVTPGTPPTLAAKDATRTIPIVMVFVADPVGQGLVAGLARPGGNITGLSSLGEGITAKQLQLLKEFVPKVSRVAVLRFPADPVHPLLVREAEGAARALGVLLQVLEAGSPNDFDRAFAAMARERAGALLVLAHPIFFAQRARIADLAAKARRPAMYALREYVEAGGLISYGTHLPALFRRAATYVDKILKGAKPADLPVEQPTRFELVVNLKTAKALGLTIPQSVLIRADQVIQ